VIISRLCPLTLQSSVVVTQLHTNCSSFYLSQRNGSRNQDCPLRGSGLNAYMSEHASVWLTPQPTELTRKLAGWLGKSTSTQKGQFVPTVGEGNRLRHTYTQYLVTRTWLGDHHSRTPVPMNIHGASLSSNYNYNYNCIICTRWNGDDVNVRVVG